MGAMLFGYTKLYGDKDGGQAEFLRVPHASYTHIKVPEDGPDERYVYLSDVLPTAWQAVEYAGIPEGGSVTVLGLGPIGDLAEVIRGMTGGRGTDSVIERSAWRPTARRAPLSPTAPSGCSPAASPRRS